MSATPAPAPFSRAQVREPIDARGPGRWRTHAVELAPRIAALDAA